MPIQFPGGPSIYDQIGQGVKSVEDYRAIRDLATQRGQAIQQGALGLLTGQQKADEYTRGLKEQDALRSLLGDSAFNRNAPEARARVYQAAPGLADKVFQGWSAQDKSAADVTHLGAQTEQQKAAATKAASENANLVLGQFKQFIPNVQTAQDMEELTKAMYAHPIAGPIMASHAPLEKALAAIPQDPKVLQENLKKWAMGTTDYVKDQTTRQGHELTAGTSLATNAATNAAHVQTNAATVAEQRRAHNMQDTRAREMVAAGGKPPPGYRATTEGNLEAIPGGPADLKLQGALNADTQALTGTTASFDRLAAAANEVLQHPGLKGITGKMGALPNIPGGQAANAEALLGTLKSQVGFGVLQDLRNNSKTGGALGNVSDAEGKRLEANLAALDKSQSLDQYQANLRKIVSYAESAKDRLRQAYNVKHSGNAGPAATAPEPSKPGGRPPLSSFGGP